MKCLREGGSACPKTMAVLAGGANPSGKAAFPTRPEVAFHLMTSAVKSADRGEFERSPEARRISEQTVDKRSQRRAAGKNQ